MQLPVQRLQPAATLPAYYQSGDDGMDLYAAETINLPAQQRVLVPTGIAMAIPTGYVGLVWDKSGIATKTGVTTLAGVIDASYRGEIKIALYNTSDRPQTIAAGQKIAQLLIQPVVQAELTEVSNLTETTRGSGGFGSTGV
jgi:dUTP pyrophosphatase